VAGRGCDNERDDGVFDRGRRRLGGVFLADGAGPKPRRRRKSTYDSIGTDTNGSSDGGSDGWSIFGWFTRDGSSSDNSGSSSDFGSGDSGGGGD